MIDCEMRGCNFINRENGGISMGGVDLLLRILMGKMLYWIKKEILVFH